MSLVFFKEKALDRILIVSSSESGTKVLTDLLRSAGFENITASSSAADARRRSTVESYDLSIINMPLSDETGKELSFDIADKNVSGVITIVNNGHEQIIGSFGRKKGIYIVMKPLNRIMFLDAVVFVLTAQKQKLRLIKKNEELARALTDLKIITKAKFLLMEKNGMSEENAHHFIERSAMDQRLSKRYVAEAVISAEGIPKEWENRDE